MLGGLGFPEAVFQEEPIIQNIVVYFLNFSLQHFINKKDFDLFYLPSNQQHEVF